MTSTDTTPAKPSPDARATHRYARQDAFVAAIIALCARDKGTQAALRSGLGRPVEHCALMHRHLVPLLRTELDDPVAERAYYSVAALIADRPRAVRDADAARRQTQHTSDPAIPSTRANLGASLARGVRAKALKEDLTEQRLRRFARQDAEQLHRRLPSIARHLHQVRIEIDWAVLLSDLARWDRDRDQVITAWNRSFYRTLHSSSLTSPDA